MPSDDKRIRAVRGAITVASDESPLILEATRELLLAMAERNGIEPEDIVSVIFTVTHDLRADFPAHAARELGWIDVPLICMMEIPVPKSLPRCIRVLLHAETNRPRDMIRHVYLREARSLRPDLLSD